jgi:acyl-lipid omega-3 desaturase
VPLRVKITRLSDLLRILNVQTQPIVSSGESLTASGRTRQDLPFTLSDVRAAIPDYCFQPKVWRSLAYAAWDVGVVSGLTILAATIDTWWIYPLYWFAQSTMFWALFVIGHDCGHGSFSKHKWLNNLVGHITHSFILVPYHGWRISHRTHHANTGNVETDESWYPINETSYREMGFWEKGVRFNAFLLAYPLYLFRRSPGKQGSHFSPNSPLFKPSERNDVITSTVCWISMVVLLVLASFQFGLLPVLKLYVVPYIGFVIWLDLVTFLHHGEADIPWYRGEDWYFLKGALSTIDRDYGVINWIHHDIGTHVAHHIFSNMPHYYLKDATAAVKPLLGEYYRKSDVPIWKAFLKSAAACHYVVDQGSPVYYQPENSIKS